MSKTKKKKKKRSKVLRCDNINKKGPGLPKLTMKPSLILSMILNFMQNFKNFAKVKFRDILLSGTGHRDRRLNRDCPGQTGTYGRSSYRRYTATVVTNNNNKHNLFSLAIDKRIHYYNIIKID